MRDIATFSRKAEKTLFGEMGSSFGVMNTFFTQYTEFGLVPIRHSETFYLLLYLLHRIFFGVMNYICVHCTEYQIFSA